MRNVKIALALVLVLVMGMAFAGCTSCSKQGPTAGTYDLYEITGDNGTTHEEIAQLEQSGFALFINLNEDGTYDFIYVGTDSTGKWSCEDGTNVVFTPDEGSPDMTDCTFSDGKLTMTLYGEETVFEKGDAKNIDDYI